MFKNIIAIFFIFAISFVKLNAQDFDLRNNNNDLNSKQDIKLDLRNKILNATEIKSPGSGINQNIKLTENKKSSGLAMILSLIVPGAGHFYAGRMDVGKYFLTGEVMSWLGIVGLNLYGNAVRDDSRSFASMHSGLNVSGKSDDYFSNVGNYTNIYEYNDDKLRKGEYDKLYDINNNFWSWDNTDNKYFFDNQRKKSERIYNSRIIFASVLVVNRIVSAISSLILVNSRNNNSTSFRINSEPLSNRNKLFDGIKISLSKSF
jgi:hypothetical protein